jgi:hypothetical protein
MLGQCAAQLRANRTLALVAIALAIVAVELALFGASFGTRERSHSGDDAAPASRAAWRNDLDLLREAEKLCRQRVAGADTASSTVAVAAAHDQPAVSQASVSVPDPPRTRRPLPVDESIEVLMWHRRVSVQRRKLFMRGDASSELRSPLLPLPPEKCVPPRMKELPRFTRRRISERPKYAIVTMTARHNGSSSVDNATMREALQRYTFVNKLQYAQRHGYDLIVEGDAAVYPGRAAQWGKIRALQKWLRFYEWVMWMDQDTLFTGRWDDFAIEHVVVDWREQHDAQRRKSAHAVLWKGRELPPLDLIITHDWQTLNSGVFFLSNSTWSHGLLERMARVSVRDALPFADQGALIYLLQRAHMHGLDTPHVYDVPNNMFNAVPSNLIREERDLVWAHSDGDAVAHFASCKFFSDCGAQVRSFYVQSLCDNGASDAPGGDAFRAPEVYYPPLDAQTRHATFPPLPGASSVERAHRRWP